MATAEAALNLYFAADAVRGERSVRVQRGCCDNEAVAVLFARRLRRRDFGNEISTYESARFNSRSL